MSMDPSPRLEGLTVAESALKRVFDVLVALIVLITLGWIIPLVALVIRLDRAGPGIFRQIRIGKDGRAFTLLKLRTMRPIGGASDTSVTVSGDPRITRLGLILRRTKLDELPQFINVLRGEMSLVGPRPDVPGFADDLQGEDRIVLSVRPGMTGPATLAFRHEEELLARQQDPESFNREVLFPAKVEINRRYVQNWHFRGDLQCLWFTISGRGESPWLGCLG